MRIERWTAPTGRVRTLLHMDPAAADRYARAARLAVPRSVAGPASFGSARAVDRPPRFPTERRAWRLALVRAAQPGDVAESGDVAACYPSIGEHALRAVARASGGDPEPVLRVLDDVHALGVRGLPIGPTASSYLADSVLSLADLAAARAGAPPLRWVDDVVFVGAGETVARSAMAWRGALRELGLADHEGKRRSGAEVLERALGGYVTASIFRGDGHGIIRL